MVTTKKSSEPILVVFLFGVIINQAFCDDILSYKEKKERVRHDLEYLHLRLKSKHSQLADT